jgi:hypothetical protein
MTVEVRGRGEVKVEAVVTENGDLLVPSSEVQGWALVPGQRVPLRGAPPHRRRRDMYGVLAGKVRDVPYEEFEEASREAWGEWARD